MDLDLKERVYIVAGGAAGLGRAVADSLVAEGARVVLAGSNEGALATAVADLGETRATFVVTDASRAGDTSALIAAAEGGWGRLDGALITMTDAPSGEVRGLSDEQWKSAFETGFLGTLRLMRCIAAALPPRGSLVLVLSPGVHEPRAGSAIADALERGLATVSLQLADELGPQGIRVNGLLAGPVMQQDPPAPEIGTGPAEGATIALDDIPLRRYGTPEEFGRVAAFILSPASSYISGSMVPVDGGMSRFG